MVDPKNSQSPQSQSLDSVAETLTRLGGSSPMVIEWMEHQRELRAMRRRALWCVFSGWLLVTTAAIISSCVAISMSGSIRDIFGDQIRGDSWSVFAIMLAPWLLAATGAVLLVAGIAGFMSGRMPGLRSTFSAIDWSSASDAVRRLLSVGCTYPDAFRTAAAGMHRCESQHWLLRAVDRVEMGQAPTEPNTKAHGDTAVLELLLDAGESEPQTQWGLASQHFLDVGHRRLTLLTQTIPMFSTLLAGFLIWISISTTLGWMWRTVGSMVQGFR